MYDPAAKNFGELLDGHPALSEWSIAVAGTGAAVSTVQRFGTAGRVERDGVTFDFVRDKQPPWLSTTGAPQEFIAAVAAQSPDIVHVNGLIFPQLVAGIRAAVGGNTAIVVQHHAGEFPIRGSGLVGMWQRQRWRQGLAAADAISFTAAEQAEPWRAAGVVGDQRIITLVEASTTLRSVSRDRARMAIGVTGDPLILWVGRLTTTQDPITILEGLERALPQLPGAQVVMLFGDDTLRDSVEPRIRASALLASRVLLVSRVAFEEMANYYNAADVFVSGSHSEGSGLALVEALSAGVVPLVSDIPSFRAIAGPCGARFQPGDAAAFADALLRTCAANRASSHAAAKAHFDRELSWQAIAARTVAEYQSIVEARRAG